MSTGSSGLQTRDLLLQCVAQRSVAQQFRIALQPARNHVTGSQGRAKLEAEMQSEDVALFFLPAASASAKVEKDSASSASWIARTCTGCNMNHATRFSIDMPVCLFAFAGLPESTAEASWQRYIPRAGFFASFTSSASQDYDIAPRSALQKLNSGGGTSSNGNSDPASIFPCAAASRRPYGGVQEVDLLCDASCKLTTTSSLPISRNGNAL